MLCSRYVDVFLNESAAKLGIHRFNQPLHINPEHLSCYGVLGVKNPFIGIFVVRGDECGISCRIHHATLSRSRIKRDTIGQCSNWRSAVEYINMISAFGRAACHSTFVSTYLQYASAYHGELVASVTRSEVEIS